MLVGKVFCGAVGTGCAVSADFSSRNLCGYFKAQTAKTIVRKQNSFEKLSPKRLLQLSAAGEVFLEGTCPLSRRPQTAKFPAPVLLGARRKWVRKAIAFRGRCEQDRSALCPVYSADILETFRWNVSNGMCLDIKPTDTARRVPTAPQNTSPTALSWISLMGQRFRNRFVSARCFS